MATYTWQGDGGGDWTNSADWAPNGVPGAKDTADFATGGNAYTVTGNDSVDGLAVDADQVTFEGTVGVGAGGFSATDGASVLIDQAADFTVSSLSFDSTALLQVAGLLVDQGGGSVSELVDSGSQANLTVGGTLTVDQLYLYQGATFAGALAVNDGGSVTLDTSADFGAANIDFAGSGSLYLASAGQGANFAELSTALQVSNTLTLGTDPGAFLALDGSISGGFVDVSGANSASGTLGGWVSLTGTNTYSYGTLVDGATLTLTGANAAGTGAVFLTDNAVLETVADSTGGSMSGTVVALGTNDTVFASAGSLVAFNATTAGFIFEGGTGSSTVVGGHSVMFAQAGAGGGVLYAGTSGHDTLIGGSGAVALVTASGGTLVATGAAQDTLVAAGGSTILDGSSSSGNNVFFTSGSGVATVKLGSGVDTVLAAGSSTAIAAGTGTGDVFLANGFSQLDFVNGANTGGTMNVIGFASGDLINLAGYAPGEAQAALSSETVFAGNTILRLSDNEHIVLFGVTNLTANSFT